MPYKSVKLDDVVRFVGGGTPSKQDSSFWNGSIPWVSPKDMKSFYISGSVDSITDTGLRDSACNLIPTGSVLTVVRSGVLIHTLPVALTTVPCALNQDMKAMIPSALLRSPFLAYWLLSKEQHILTTCVKKGATVQSIAMENLRSQEIPLPPLPEQDRIVEILDQADTLRQQRRQADALSQRILPALFQEMFGDPLARNSKWDKKPLGRMGTLDRGVSKSRPRNSPELLGGSYPLIQTGDIANSAGVIKSFSSTYSEAGLAQSKLWPAKTLCITIAANIGKTAILEFEACFPDSVVGFIPNEETNVEYVQYLFHFFQPMLEMNAPQAAQKNINLKTLRDLEAPAPPHALQERFGESVRLFRDCAARQTTSAATLETLFQTLLHRAFDGSLTAKWRERHAKEVLQEMKHQTTH